MVYFCNDCITILQQLYFVSKLCTMFNNLTRKFRWHYILGSFVCNYNLNLIILILKITVTHSKIFDRLVEVHHFFWKSKFLGNIYFKNLFHKTFIIHVYFLKTVLINLANTIFPEFSYIFLPPFLKYSGCHLNINRRFYYFHIT